MGFVWAGRWYVGGECGGVGRWRVGLWMSGRVVYGWVGMWMDVRVGEQRMKSAIHSLRPPLYHNNTTITAPAAAGG